MAALLETALATPHRFGFSQPDEVLSTVAARRKQNPSALRGPIAARRFLVAHFPELASEEKIECGFSPVQILSSLYLIDERKTRELIASVLRGEITTAQIRATYKKAAEIADRDELHRRPVGSAKRRGAEFSKIVRKFVAENVQLFSDSQKIEILDRRQIGPLAPDLILAVDDKPEIAIEIKLPGTSAYKRQANEMVGLCGLMLKRVSEVWVIAPLSAKAQLERMHLVARTFDLNGARFACLDEGLAKSGSPDALQEIRPA